MNKQEIYSHAAKTRLLTPQIIGGKEETDREYLRIQQFRPTGQDVE